jgi:pimeloyl-ACP methyl ester carboxylesterase
MRAAIVLLTLLVSVAASGQTPQGYNRPGRMIDIDGRKLYLNCSGKRSPTIILVAGGDAFSIDWALVQPRVAGETRVCSYDRAGLGWSDSGPADETVEQTVSDLHALLQAAGEKPPYLMVGASIGGIFIRAYQHAFPNEVGGLVFTNSSNQVGMPVKGKVGLLWALTEGEIRSAYPLPSTMKGTAPTSEGEPFDRLPAELQAVRLGFDKQIWEKFDPAQATPAQNLSWRKEFLREFAETDADKDRPLDGLPVIVLSSNPVASEDDRKSREGAGARLDFLSSNDVHITATGSGHEIHPYQPDMVVQALERGVLAVRNWK